MGLDYGGSESGADYPKGCYRMTSNGKVYFNSHATGSGDSGSQPLCSGTLASGAPQPPRPPWLVWVGIESRFRTGLGLSCSSVPPESKAGGCATKLRLRDTLSFHRGTLGSVGSWCAPMRNRLFIELSYGLMCAHVMPSPSLSNTWPGLLLPILPCLTNAARCTLALPLLSTTQDHSAGSYVRVRRRTDGCGSIQRQ